jgi:hypothetical protein
MSLIYSMLMFVDGYVEDDHGRFSFCHSRRRGESLHQPALVSQDADYCVTKKE